MFKSIAIKNFRCFDSITIDSLERINLIGGSNNVGKTALLEALFLRFGLNSLELPLKLNLLRGMVGQETFDLQDICQWLFYDKRSDRLIQITTTDEEERRSKLKLRLTTAVDLRYISLNYKLNQKRTIKDLELEYNEGEETLIWKIFLTADSEELEELKLGIKVEQGEIKLFPPSNFIGSRVRNYPPEDAENFSKLEAEKRQKEVIEILKILEPRLKDLAVLVTGGMATLYGDIGLNYLVPIPLMGEGMARLLSIVLAIMNAADGTILIDEIENGLHHSVFEKIMEAIALAARKSNVQIFATTHSWECIEAAHEAFSKSEIYDFRYYRLEADKKQNNLKVLTYNRETINTSVKMQLEMR